MTMRQSMPMLFGAASGAGLVAFYVADFTGRWIGGDGLPGGLEIVFQIAFTFVATFGASMLGFLAWGALAWLDLGASGRIGRRQVMAVAVAALVAGMALRLWS